MRVFSKIGPVCESALIIVGLLVLFALIPQGIGGDGAVRFEAISELMTTGSSTGMKYSIIGPLFSIPLWLIGSVNDTAEWWCARYNFFIFALGMLAFYLILRNRLDRGVLRKFLLFLVLASMFPHHQMSYYGEIFTAVLVSVGILAIGFKHTTAGWICVILGVANTPASIPALGLVAVAKALQDKRWRYLLAPLAAVAVFAAESWIYRGSPLFTGYEEDKGFQTLLPYSGLANFSYPFFFGLLSILFSFGKGLVFYCPGLLLPVKKRLMGTADRDAGTPAADQTTAEGLLSVYRLWLVFVAGLVITYSKWWAWYGGYYWGPRFFLIASVPAAFALAVFASTRNRSFWVNLTALVVLSFSLWVGLNGALFGQYNLDICTSRNYALEAFCWYTPEFSPLFHPFIFSEHRIISHRSFSTEDMLTAGYWLLASLYLILPVALAVIRTGAKTANEIRIKYIDFKMWRL